MALKYLGILALFLTVTSVKAQCNLPVQFVYNGCITSINQKTNAGTICSGGEIAELIKECSGQCSDLLRSNAYYIGQLANALNTAKVACGTRIGRACGLTEALQCTLAVVSFAQNVGTLGNVQATDAAAVCGYVNQYSTDINTCQSFINECIGLADPNTAAITNQIKSITAYVLTATGQSCVCIEKATSSIPAITTFANNAQCGDAQTALSTLIDSSIACTSALPANPIPGISVFSLDFRATVESMVRVGAAAAVSTCSLQFVSSGAAFAGLSMILFVATLTFHYLRPYNREG